MRRLKTRRLNKGHPINVLVTGGAGYIGSHTAKLLKRSGDTPIVYDDLSEGHREFLRFGPHVMGDIRDESRLQQALSDHHIAAVIHFAGKTSVEESHRMPGEYFSHNVSGTISLLRAMEKAGITRLVYSSSAAVYGETDAGTIREDHPTHPSSPYGLTKLLGEQAIRSIAPSFGLRYALLRYFNVVGRDPEGDVWEWHEPETHVLPNLIQALGEDKPFHLFGSDYPTEDGSAIRDYVDVMDLAQVHLEALARLEKEEHFISNVGNGSGLSVRELLGAVEKAMGRPVRTEEHPRRLGDPPRLVADHTYLLEWCVTARGGFRSMEETLQGLLKAKPAPATPP